MASASLAAVMTKLVLKRDRFDLFVVKKLLNIGFVETHPSRLPKMIGLAGWILHTWAYQLT